MPYDEVAKVAPQIFQTNLHPVYITWLKIKKITTRAGFCEYFAQETINNIIGFIKARTIVPSSLLQISFKQWIIVVQHLNVTNIGGHKIIFY